MPPANQGSKAALVTWTVVATVFGITMAVLALIAYAGRNDAEVRLDRLESQYSDVVSQADLTGARVNDLKAAAREENRTGNVFSYLLSREDQLASTAAGTPGYDQAIQEMQARLQLVNSRQADGVSASSLVGAVDQLMSRIDAMRQENQALTRANEQLLANLQQAQQTAGQEKQALQQQIEQLQQQQQETLAQMAEVQAGVQEVVDQANAQMAQLAQGAQQQQQVDADQIAQLNQTNERLQQQFQRLNEIFRRDRFRGDQMLTTADGRVLRSPSEGVLYVNLGRNDGVTNGMTFEVYDSVLGIPTLESEDELPRGKGSIQIIRVLPNSAEARIIAQTPGQVIREGDVIANLAYDPNVPVRFRVYGDFDLDNSGQTDPRDRDRITSLIREFGGEVVDRVTVDTDVLVMGQQPQVPTPPRGQENDPVVRQRIYQAQQRLNAYNEVMRQAQELSIPILNQNQFLYYIGYFDQAKR